MNLRPMLIANGALVALMAGASAWGWNIIPDDAQIPMHWNFAGEVDDYGSKTEALIFMPAIALGITFLLAFLPRLDPRRENIETSMKFWNAVAISVVAFLAYIHVLIVLIATGTKIDLPSAMVPGISALFILIGNYLQKTRSNWFGGVRTPWTMSSEYSWEKTHRLAGRLFIGTGLITIVAWLLSSAMVAIIVLGGALLASVIVSVVMSYVFWRDDPERQANGHV